MSITMHSASAPIFVAMLDNMSAWLTKAEAHAAAKKFEPAVLLAARLAPDMLPLTTQVQIACDTAKFLIARLAGVDAPKFDDSEASLADLRQRIAATIEFVKSVPDDKVDGTEDKDVTLPRRTGPIVMKGEAYLKHFALPNLFFPRDHDLRAAAAQRCRGRQDGFSWRAEAVRRGPSRPCSSVRPGRTAPFAAACSATRAWPVRRA